METSKRSMAGGGIPESPAPNASQSRLRLRVQGADGPCGSLEFAGVSEAEAVRMAAVRGFRVLAIETGSAPPARVGPRERFPLLLFAQELLALLEAGLTLNEALGVLHAKAGRTALREVLAEVLAGLARGRNFSDVLADNPQAFPEVFIATVRASERTGGMAQALARYVAYQIQFDAVGKKLVSAAIYPVMLLGVGMLVTLFLLGYVVPKFAAVYDASGRDLPWMSGVLLSFGRAIHQHWQIALALAAGAGGALLAALLRPGSRAFLLSRVVRLPGLAARADAFRLARFYRALSLLLSAGIALPRAMQMAAGLLDPAQRLRLEAARKAVESGHKLSAALLAQGLAGPVAESLIKVGERSGQMADMLERTARFNDDDFSRWLDWASRLIEPILMTVIGVVIGCVVVLMYLPIFELAGSLQ